MCCDWSERVHYVSIEHVRYVTRVHCRDIMHAAYVISMSTRNHDAFNKRNKKVVPRLAAHASSTLSHAYIVHVHCITQQCTWRFFYFFITMPIISDQKDYGSRKGNRTHIRS